ncbi:homocitrate synthase [Acanthopleuribacter pedis]|uniref:Homocitrate synthase n=1 Tax=Acanthopleuribacter pedis TaxID=442870 RepID=A0A8J7QMQ2_9BACT|nr:homocitrate synthase [Acanthopleuribacter pedis]MBO1321233.1 homocitrate synthase [Acanthopleuribacter pedis]
MRYVPCAVIDSTLREGEQFARASFSPAQKIQIARALDAFGVEYIEVTSPCASPQSFEDCRAIVGLGLRAKILTHTRCHMDDVQRALAAGVDGINLVLGTSSFLREFSHGKSIDAVIQAATEVITFLQQFPVEVRFSCEDSMRTSIDDLLRVYRAVDALGVDRVGIADTVGAGTPRQIYDLVSRVRAEVQCGIEFHGHNDTGCAVANAFAAWEAGATHIDTTVLGIGERNGIAPLSDWVARLHATAPRLTAHYHLPGLVGLDRLVAEMIGLEIPFTGCVTSFCAFTHKAGIHTKAVINHPQTYEILAPEAFGLTREILTGHRLTGWNAVAARGEALGVHLCPDEARSVARFIKAISDRGPLNQDQVDQCILTMVPRADAHPVSAVVAESEVAYVHSVS